MLYRAALGLLSDGMTRVRKREQSGCDVDGW